MSDPRERPKEGGAESAWEAACMSCDPFEGDFGGSGQDDSVLSDKMVTARKAGECHTCAGQVVPGTRVRRRAEVYDGEFMRFGWCEECCRAMAASDDDETYEARIALGQERRVALPAAPQGQEGG